VAQFYSIKGSLIMLREIFNNDDELKLFCEHMARKANEQINADAEAAAIEPIVEVSVDTIRSAVREFVK